MALVLAGGCSSSDADPESERLTSVEEEGLEEPDGVAAADWTAIKDQIRADRSHFSHRGPIDTLGLADAWVVRNAPQRLEAVFGDARMAARVQGSQSWALELQTTAWGRRGTTTPLAAPTRHVEGPRLEYRRPKITEWYINGSEGIQHGFDVAEKPAGDGPLRVEVTVGGELEPRLISAEAVMLMSDTGEHVLRYTGLLAEDARGVELPAHFEVQGARVAIVVDDRTATYPLVIDPFVQQAKLLASDGAEDDEFGHSVAVSGGTIVVGSPFDDDNDFNSGSAYVFEDSGSGFVQTTKLLASDGDAFDRFGYAVAVSGDTIVVGAPFDNGDPMMPLSDSGSVYVFEDRGSGFVETARLLASDGDALDQFGNSVAVSGDTIVVGAPNDGDNGQTSGSAFVFEDNGSGFVETTKLLASDGEALDGFGNSVSVSGDTIVVGASLDNNDSGNNAGSAYVFEDGGSGFVETTRLLASDRDGGDQFGESVGVSGDTIVVGAVGDRFGDPSSFVGAAYVFEDSGGGFLETTKLVASNRESGDWFGISVSVSGDTIVVGSWLDDDNGAESGSAYVFEDGGSGFVQAAKFLANDGAQDDQFGRSVAISGDTIVVGAALDDDNGQDSGSAYVFGPPNVAPMAHEFLRADGMQVDATEDLASTITLAGTDDDGDQVTFEIVTDPENGTLSITATDGVQTGTFDGADTTTLGVTYTPTSETATSDAFTYRVDDGEGGADTGTVEIDITLVNEAPTITSTAPTSGTEDMAYAYDPTATDPEADTLTWSTTASDTCGGTFTDSSYTFTPSSPGLPTDCVVGIEVCDDGAPSECDTQDTTVTITAIDTDDDPDIDEMPVDTDPDEEPEESGPGQDSAGSDEGCGCSSARATSNGVWALFVLALLRLRRRAGDPSSRRLCGQRRPRG